MYKKLLTENNKKDSYLEENSKETAKKTAKKLLRIY